MKVEYLSSGSNDCPLIRIFGTNREEAISLRKAILSLADGTKMSVSTEEIFGLASSQNCRVVMSLGQTDLAPTEPRDGEFQWVLTVSGWKQVAELLSPFTHNARKGSYQWIGGDNVGEVSILFSFSEGGHW
ncbi:MAG: hypothetical protein AAFN59_13300 [Pseudomonadota bacterium]